MKSNYKFSVIIPTYYRNEYLRKSIDSVLAQTYKEFEIIIVDDSLDGHAQQFVEKVISNNKEYKIRYLNSKGLRQGAARNIGIREAKGDIISFLDDDDLWLPQKLELEHNLFMKWGEEVVIYGGRTIHDLKGEVIDTYIPKYNPYFASHLIKLFNFVAFPAFSFFKKIIENVGYLREDYMTHEDWEFLNRIALHYDFIPLKQVVARINKHENNRDKEHNGVWEKDKLSIFKEYKPYWTSFTNLLYFLRQTKLRIKGQKY